jgi:hypothetical protein
MKRIILCEGKTDALLLGWKYTKNEAIKFPIDKDNEVLYWYDHSEKPDQELAIWGVGGIDRIPIGLSNVISRTRRERGYPDNRFDKIAIFFDRDKRTNGECLELLKTWFKDNQIDIKPKLGQWLHTVMKLAINTDHQLNILPIVLPTKAKGNLEIFLTNSLRDQSVHDKLLVDKTKRFINKIPDEPYLTKDRLRSKACLGSILSVISPDWVFSELDRRLKLIEWEKLESVSLVYSLLGEL